MNIEGHEVEKVESLQKFFSGSCARVIMKDGTEYFIKPKVLRELLFYMRFNVRKSRKHSYIECPVLNSGLFAPTKTSETGQIQFKGYKGIREKRSRKRAKAS